MWKDKRKHKDYSSEEEEGEDLGGRKDKKPINVLTVKPIIMKHIARMRLGEKHQGGL
jgi:hypothetical protein